MSLRRFVTILIGIMLVFSCTDDLVQENNQGVPIRIVSGTKATTRAADNLNTEFANNTPINVAVDGIDYNYTTNGAGIPMTCTSATPPYFPIDGSSVKLQAYYPYSILYSTSPQTFTVSELQNNNDQYVSSDLMYGEPSPNGTPVGWSGLDGDAKVMPTADPVPLVFQHKLVKIKVNITTNGATVSTVTLNNIKRRVPFTPSTGALGSAEEYTGHTDVRMFSGSTTANFTCTAIIPPQTIGTSPNFLTVVTSIHNLTYKLPAEVSFASGSQYIYNVTILGTEISVSSTVSTWDDGGTATAPVDFARNQWVNPLWYMAESNLKLASDNTTFSFDNTGNTTQGTQFQWSSEFGSNHGIMGTKWAAQTSSYDGWNVPANSSRELDGETWHVPTLQEMISIVPVFNPSTYDKNMFGTGNPDPFVQSGLYTEPACVFGYSPETQTPTAYQSYWSSYTTPSVRYAIRFLGTPYCSVWKYQFYSNNSSTARLVITSKLIDPIDPSNTSALSAKLSEIMSTNYNWTSLDPNLGEISRTIYMCGYTLNAYSQSASGSSNNGLGGALWTTTSSGNSYYLNMYSTVLDIRLGNPSNGISVRLFRDGNINRKRPKLPIEYIAPYNLYDDTHMATDNKISSSKYFCWNTSTAESGGVGTPSNWSKAKANIQAMIKGTAVTGYHLPSKAEWCSIIAPHAAGSDDTSMGGDTGSRVIYKNGLHTNLSETVAWGVSNSDGTYSYAVNQVFYNDYNCPNDDAHAHIGYGLRFKEKSGSNYVNGQYTCAYRYEYKESDSSLEGIPSLTIKVIYVGANTGITISTISNESWWSLPEFTVVLPACGYSHYQNGRDYQAGWGNPDGSTQGYYWSATAKDASAVCLIGFAPTHVDGNYWNQPGYGFSVRLFKDR